MPFSFSLIHVSAVAKVIVRDETTKDSDIFAPLYECNLMRNVSGLKIKINEECLMSLNSNVSFIFCVVLACIMLYNVG